MNFHGKQVGVLGAGRSGQACARLLLRRGAKVLLSDSGHPSVTLAHPQLTLEQGGHSNRLLDCDLLIRSPGVPGDLPILRQAQRHRLTVWSELELAWRLVRPCRTVAITGTNGKTTTTAWVGHVFKACRQPVVVAGNIGTPLSEWVDRVTPRTTLVLEVSSYQLENIEAFHPQAAALLNVTPDHLEHHKTLSAYASAKARLFENQTHRDIAVFNAEDAICRRLARHCSARVWWFSRCHAVPQGFYVRDRQFVFRRGQRLQAIEPKLQIPGGHNVENALAACALAMAGGLELQGVERALGTFTGVSHRLEVVRELRGTRFVNDSKSTNVDSARVALEAFCEPLILIMGGRGKGATYRPLWNLVEEKVKALLLIGEDAPRIATELGGATAVVPCGSLDRAVQEAAAIASPGDAVLLSPACASFDQYRNFEERGEHFRQLVQSLK